MGSNRVVQKSDTGFPVEVPFDGKLFNLRRLQAKTKVQVQADVLVQMIWIRMPAQRQKCKRPWIKSHNHVIRNYDLTFNKSAQQRQGLYNNQSLKNI